MTPTTAENMSRMPSFDLGMLLLALDILVAKSTG